MLTIIHQLCSIRQKHTKYTCFDICSSVPANTQTDEEIDGRETDRRRQRQTDGERDRQTETDGRETDRQTDVRERDRETERQTDEETDGRERHTMSGVKRLCQLCLLQ